MYMYELGRIIGYVIFVGFIIGILWGGSTVKGK